MEDPTNIYAVLAATVAAMILGTLWYGPVFGTMWRRLEGLSLEDMKTMKLSPAVTMGLMAVLSFLMNYVLAHGIAFGNAYIGMSGAEGGMTGAFWYWLGFALPLTAGSFLWLNKSWKLWAFHASYYLVTLLVAGAIIGSWV